MQKLGGVAILMKNTNIEYLFGRENVEVVPNIPYAIECYDFLDSLSKAICNDREAKQYSDIMTFAFWLRKANILRLKEEYNHRNNQNIFGFKTIGKGLIFHIAPSNVPINFAYTLIFGLLSGNSNIVKVSSKKFRQIDIICRIMKQIIEVKQFEWVYNQNAIVTYDRDQDEYTKYFSDICDVRIIWGGDHTIQQVRKFALQPRSTEITFADRYSFAVLSSHAVLKASESERKNLAKQFYNDTYLMDQNACSSPHLICWIGEKEEVSAASQYFWEEVYHVCAEKYDLADIKVSEKYTILCELAIQLDQLDIQRYENVLYVVKLKKLPEEITNLKGKFGLFFEYHLDKFSDIYSYINKKVQTCAIYGIDLKEIIESITDMHIRGIDRVVPIGKTLDISTIWDGYDIISQLSRYIKYEDIIYR
ncbi:MAG: acyl-CoA reductase [Lachnospiraceae bacterium]|jgi:hypothetical protein|nr:acyl-CoA reductase [Lachnospiraceae bacterium]